MYISPDHRTDGSDEEEIASIDNSVSQLSPCAFVIRTFVTDDIDFLRATEEPADECQSDETTYYAKRHVRFAAVGLPVIGKLNANHSQSNQDYQSDKDVDPDEECIGEARNIQEITGYLETTVGSTEEEQRDEHESQTQQRPKGNLRNHFIVFHIAQNVCC